MKSEKSRDDDSGDGNPGRKNTDRRRVLAGVLAAVILAVIVAANSIVVIPTGYTGVRTTFGQVDQKVIPNGISFKIPFVQQVAQINNKQQDAYFDGQVWSETSDMTEIYYDQITVTYQINPEMSTWIYANVTNYQNALVNATVVNSAVKEASKQLESQNATNRGMIEPLVQETLQTSLDEKYGRQAVIIDRVTIGDANFEDSYNQAIASRQKSQIEAEQQAIENQKAIDKAEADAKVKRTQAQAEADAEVIKAQGQADANRLLNDSITENTLRQSYIDKWDGQLPKVTSGSDTIVSMGDLEEGSAAADSE